MENSVLVVEDDATIRENLAEILEMEGYGVALAGHGREALDQLGHLFSGGGALPSAILLDLNMPVMPGREFLAALRVATPELAKIPVIVMTAVPDAVDLGTAAFLRKPIDLDDLLRVLDEVCSVQGKRA